MPTKTDKILSYLPGTFRSLPKPNALRSIVDAFGTELLKGENSLAALMLAHWVDHADRDEEIIQDLARIASLYGLSPRGAESTDNTERNFLPVASDETVEEFREHLKRYVKIFLDGTVTVQGILRVAAESLALRINDDYADLDTWWTRGDDGIDSVKPRGDDASELLFGVKAVNVSGHAAQPARIIGQINLPKEIDLGENTVLQLKIDNADTAKIELPRHTSLDQIEEVINTALAEIIPAQVKLASRQSNRLVIASPTVGPGGRVEILDTSGDASLPLFGLLPHLYRGADATKARVNSLHFDETVDLSEVRFMRLSVDGKLLAEVDCAARSTDKKRAKLEDITKSINDAFSKAAFGDDAPETEIATHANGILTLTSPTEGFASSITFLPAAAQDAREKLFGSISTSHVGNDPLQASVTGQRDLSQGVDLSARSLIRLRIDGEPSITIDCAGDTPTSTFPSEITTAINNALGGPLATHNGRFIRLVSAQAGPSGLIKFETLPEDQDATEIIFGIQPRISVGTLPTSARLVGIDQLNGIANLGALNKLLLSIDGAVPKEIDLRSHADNPPDLVPLAKIADAINAAFEESVGEQIAFDDGKHIILASPIAGSASRITLAPFEVKSRRRFVTRAFIADEAAAKLFGFSTQRAQGSDATRAMVIGAKDLSRGVDLRVARYLRLRIDNQQPIEIDCAGQRPRLTELKEIIATINAKISDQFQLDQAAIPFASSPDNKKLTLTSPNPGAASRIIFEEPLGVLSRLGIDHGDYRGSTSTGINFVGTVDLSKGVDLSAASKIKLGVSGKPPVEIDCAKKDDPQHTQPRDIVEAINKELGASVASTNGQQIIINSPAGDNSRIEFATPAAGDATKKIFGINAPRIYQAGQGTPARVVGNLDLSAGVDMRAARMLRLSVDNEDPVEIDCSARAIAVADEDGNLPLDRLASVRLVDIIAAINEADVGVTARNQSNHLIIETKNKGPVARLSILIFPGNNARQALFGNAETIEGSDPLPAQIISESALTDTVNLDFRDVIKITIDDDRPVEINTSGAVPRNTLLIEAVERINAIVPGLASTTDDNHLVLTSPTKGDESSLELLPTGVLELIEYTPAPASFPAAGEPAMSLRHGDSFAVTNDGAAESDLRIEVHAPQGVAQPAFVNRTTNQLIRLNESLQPGERAEIWNDGQLCASISDTAGTRRDIPPTHITATPLVTQTTIPFAGWQNLARNNDAESPSLLLVNSLATSSLLLRSREKEITASVAEANLTATYENLPANGERIKLIGRVRFNDGQFWLTDANDKPIARLRVSIQIELSDYLNRVVSTSGTLHQVGDDEHAERLFFVEGLAEIFDVKLQSVTDDAQSNEQYANVTIGHGSDRRDSLAWQISFGNSPSQLVSAIEERYGNALILPRGQSRWSYIDCGGPRFDQSFFDQANFAGVIYEACAELPDAECSVSSYCEERGVFDVSRFGEFKLASQGRVERVVFAPSPLNDPPVEIRFHWSQFQPGAMTLNLPADLPDKFGGRFDQARFASDSDAVEEYLGVVTEPADDPDHIVNRLQKSDLVTAKIVPSVPIGFTAVPLPIAQPRWRKLKGDDPARLYLSEKDVQGFIRLSAARNQEIVPGPWGQQIVVTARKSSAGPARFDITISYQGGRFENACQIARGGDELPARIEDFLRPSPVGILQAKAAGIHAEVTRDGAEDLG